jgi:hypothetical protein
MLKSCVFAATACLFLMIPLRAEDPIDFNRQIRPILSDKCFACHGPDSQHRKGGLRLDEEGSAKAIMRGRQAVVPGDAAKSTVIQRISSNDADEMMPPHDSGKELNKAEIDLLRRWIEAGAPWGKHWAYQPLSRTLKMPASQMIDHYIGAALQRNKLSPAPQADTVTLIRRLSFDITGLPPNPELVKRFTVSTYEQTVDQLLASPQFGERLTSYWLDLVRYADTVGYHGDQDHHASPYRDYVIDAFNRNMPFDQFTREQLAGDLLPGSTIDQKIATCYNRLLQTSHEGGVQPKEYLAIYAADRVRNLSTVWMGATVGCAQCHNHKYDPYTIKDFYSLAAFFSDVDEEKHLRGGGADTIPTRRAPEIRVLSRKQREELALLEISQALTREKLQAADESEKPTLKKLLEVEESEIQSIKNSRRLVMVTQTVTPRVSRILPRGNWLDESGPVVEPAIPEFLGKLDVGARRMNRLDLAQWLTDAKTGAGAQTSRVFVNRLWALFFGAGLSPSLEDFGNQGEAPSHPELLDALAIEFIESGWDVKKLIKTMVMSKVYQQSSNATPTAQERDPTNRWLSHQAKFRLPAEMIRDNALQISGLLVNDHAGGVVKPYQPPGYYRHLNFPKREYQADKDARQYQRSVYIHWQRQFLHPMLKAFDAPSREECTVRRQRSNTPQAALILLNDPTFLEAAVHLAGRLLRDKQTDVERIRAAVQQSLSRLPDAAEEKLLLEVLQKSRKEYQGHRAAAEALLTIGSSKPDAAVDIVEHASWTMVARVLFNLSEMNSRN